MSDFDDDEIKREIKREKARIYYRRNKRQLDYYYRNRDKIKPKMRKWVLLNRDKKNDYVQKHKDKIYNSIKEYQHKKAKTEKIKRTKKNLDINARKNEIKLREILHDEIQRRVNEYIENDKSMKKLLCIVGDSGVGKTEAARFLQEKHGANVICSYTDRPRRLGEVNGVDHYFADINPDKEDILAYTVYNGHKYYATKSQVYGPCTVYVIDEMGLIKLINDFYDVYDICPVYIERDKKLRILSGIKADRLKRDDKRGKMNLNFYNYIKINNGSIKELFSNIESIYFNFLKK